MSISKSARLILQLVDRVSGPAKAVTGALTGVNNAVRQAGAVAMAPANAVANAGRSMRRNAGDVAVASTAITYGLARAGKSIHDMDKTLNTIEGRRFGMDDYFTLADGSKMGRDAFRKWATNIVTTIDKESPRTAGEIAAALNQLVQAGLSHEQVEAILPIAVRFAIAGNYDTEEAADRLTNVMTAMQMPMATNEQAAASAQRAANVLSYAANQTNSTVGELTEAFKYAAPSAAALGLDIEQLAGMFVIQAKRGIKASEAGVSIRAMLTRMVRPTNMAQAALANYNIDLADYIERSKELTGSDVTNALQVGGLDASKADSEIDKILKSAASTPEKIQQITAAITKAVGDSSTMSADTISKVVSEVMYGFGESLDVERLIEDMQKADIAVSDFFRIFDVRQGARTLSLFSDDVGFWIEKIRRKNEGFAKAMSDVQMKGIVGAVARIDSGIFGVIRAAADSGVLDSVTIQFEKLAGALNTLAATDPQLLEIGTYGLIAAAGLAPLGFAISGLAAAAALAVNPLAWMTAGLGYLAYKNLDKVKSELKGIGEAFTGFRKTQFVQGVIRGAASALRSLGGYASTAYEHLKGLGEMLKSVADWLGPGWGESIGKAVVYFGGLALAAGAVGFAARGVFALGRAALILTGIKPAFQLVRWLTRLAAQAVGITATAKALDALTDASGRADKAGAGKDKSGDKAGAKSRGKRGFPLIGNAWAIAAGALLSLSGSTPGNEYTEASEEERQRMRDEARKHTEEYRARRAAQMQAEAEEKAAQDVVRSRDIPPLRQALSEITVNWSAAAQQGMRDYVATLDAGGAQAEAEAARIGEQIEMELAVTGNPDVNTGRLERALGLARELANAMRGIPSAGGGSPAPSEGKFGGARRRGGPVRKGLTYLVGEDGPEPFTPSQNGHVTSNKDWRGGGGGGMVVNISNRFELSGLSGDLDAQIRRVVSQITSGVEKRLDRSSQTAFSGLKFNDA